MKTVRYPVDDQLLDVDDLQRDHPVDLAMWAALKCEGTEQQINMVALAQAYSAEDGGFELAASGLRSLGDPSLKRTIELVTIGHEETLRDALYKVSVRLLDRPRECGPEHQIARARLWATCEANGIDTEGCEDPAKLRLEARR